MDLGRLEGGAAGTPEHYQAAVADIQLANETLKKVQAPFKLATAGWVLGPRHDGGAYDADLPKDIAMSAINEELGTVDRIKTCVYTQST